MKYFTIKPITSGDFEILEKIDKSIFPLKSQQTTFSKTQTSQNKICYVASVPKKETGKYKSRGNTYILLTHRPGEKKRDVFELRAGYVFKKDSEVILNIDGQITQLYTDRGTAWAEDKVEPKILKMMIRGRSMKVTGVSKRGTKTEDFYSLMGFTSAYKEISKVCGVN